MIDIMQKDMTDMIQEPMTDMMIDVSIVKVEDMHMIQEIVIMIAMEVSLKIHTFHFKLNFYTNYFIEHS